MTDERLSKEKQFAAFLYHRRGVQRENKATDWQKTDHKKTTESWWTILNHIPAPPNILSQHSPWGFAHTAGTFLDLRSETHTPKKTKKQNSKLMIGVNMRIFSRICKAFTMLAGYVWLTV